MLDGAMGTMIQALKLDEDGYRGARFDDWNRDVRGNNDLLILTQPDAIRDIHLAYFRAGADIVATNTFSSTTIAQADYGMEALAYELNRRGRAARARGRRRSPQNEDGRPRFVAGALGPTNRTASISPDVNNPGFRAITFDELRDAYARAGARPDRRRRRPAADRDDLRHAQRQGGDLRHRGSVARSAASTLPVMISGTITDLLRPHCCPARRRRRSGTRCATPSRSRSASTARSAPRRCAPTSPRSARVADTLVCAYPNAGLPNEFGHYDESPEYMAGLLGEFADGRPRQHRRRLLRHHARRTSAPSPRR